MILSEKHLLRYELKNPCYFQIKAKKFGVRKMKIEKKYTLLTLFRMNLQ